MDYIKHAGVQMVLFTLISIVANMIAGLLAARAAAGMAQTVRSDTFRKVEQFNGEEFDRFSTASLITRTTNDITHVITSYSIHYTKLYESMFRCSQDQDFLLMMTAHS